MFSVDLLPSLIAFQLPCLIASWPFCYLDDPGQQLTEIYSLVTLSIQVLFSYCLEDHIMDDKKLLNRIVLNPNIMIGKPVIRGTRLTVDFILNLLAHGASENDILSEYKGLKIEDIQACYLFATKYLENTDFMPLMEKSA